MKKIVFILFAAVIISSCCTYKINPAEYKGDQIGFGKGGGFTGRYEYFTMLRNGNVFFRSGTNDAWTLVKVIGKETAEPFFTQAYKANLGYAKIDSPGNMTYLLSLKTRNGLNEIKWGGNQQNPPPALLELYKQLFIMIKD